MIKSCTLIPTHPPKFYWLNNLLRSYMEFVKKPHDFYVVFSNETDASEFKKICRYPYYELIMPERLRDKKSIVNVKKYFGLNSISSKYEYIGVFDSECEFVKCCDLDIIYEDIASSDYFKANKASIGGDIIKKIADMLNLTDNQKLVEQTKNYSLYWWFNEIPVYKSNYYLEFADWFYSLPNLDELEREYYSFDFLVYSIWLICFKDFKLKEYDVPVEFLCGAVEEFRVLSVVKDIVSETFNSYWDANFANHQNYENIKILMHIDNRR